MHRLTPGHIEAVYGVASIWQLGERIGVCKAVQALIGLGKRLSPLGNARLQRFVQLHQLMISIRHLLEQPIESR